jgi:gliding motility-associated-like protein/uncharacterized repeat protein (TIGR01451 family)
MNTGSTIDGRLLAINGAVVLSGTNIINGPTDSITTDTSTTSINVSLEINAAPIITLQPMNQTACAGSSVSFSVVATGSGLTYQWRKGTVNIIGATSDTLTINPVNITDAALNYNVVITGTCSNDTSINVFLKVNPVYNINNPQAICNGGSYLINGHTYTTTGIYHDTMATVHGCDSIIVTQLTVNPVYSVNNPQTICNGNSYMINGHAYTIAGNYKDTLATVHGCDSIIVTQLTVNFVYNVNNPQTICNGNSYNINGHTYTIAGNYKDTLTTVHGCDSIVVTQLTVTQLPVAVANSNSPVCSGNSIDLTAQTVTGATYSWTSTGGYSSSDQNPDILSASLSDAGAYSLIVSANGCSSSPSTVTVIVNNCDADLSVVKTVNNTYPMIGHTAVFAISATDNGPADATGVTVTDILQNGYTYVSSTTTGGTYNPSTGVWTIGNLNNGATDVLTITATVNATGDYVNTVLITGNEVDPISINNVSVIETFPWFFFIPEGFSPNNDGINDLFVIKGINNYPANTINIFNRWGDKVFEASPYQNTWDGKCTIGLRIGGDELPIGTYFYTLDLGDGSNVIKGTIYLNR